MSQHHFHIVKTNRKEKFWYHNIRRINYLCYSYWWLVLIFFIIYVFLWFWFCYRVPYVSNCADNKYFIQNIDQVKKDLDSCCSCNTRSNDYGSLPPVSTICPDRILVFQVCNSNNARDDDFEVYLNGIDIGRLQLNSNDRVGSVFIASNNRALNIPKPDFICSMDNIRIYFFDPTIVKYGENIIEMKNIKSNNNNNKGTIEIRNYLLDGNMLVDPCPVKSILFEGNSGSSFSNEINYTKCCE